MIDFNDTGNVAGWIYMIFVIIPFFLSVVFMAIMLIKDFFNKISK